LPVNGHFPSRAHGVRQARFFHPNLQSNFPNGFSVAIFQKHGGVRGCFPKKEAKSVCHVFASLFLPFASSGVTVFIISSNVLRSFLLLLFASSSLF
jgi:hypothetical protein